MAQDRPTASELLAAIADFLRDEAMPVLDRTEPRLGFQMRVAVNSLAILLYAKGSVAEAEELLKEAGRMRQRLIMAGGGIA